MTLPIETPGTEPVIEPTLSAPAVEAPPSADGSAQPASPEGPSPAAQHDPQPATSAVAPAPGTPAPVDCSALLKKTFPALFGGAPKPLKLRIQTDIQERAPGVFTKQALSAFFRRYTGSTSYLVAVSRAKHRFDLDGAPAGELTEEHRKIALDELARRRGNQESRIALEAQQRRNRATLLHDFERTTLTPANFCALKGIAVDELDGYLATARREAAERPAPQSPHAAFDPTRRPPPRSPARPPQARPPSGEPRPASRRR